MNSSALTDNSQDQTILFEQIKILYKSLSAILGTNIIIVLAFVYALWGVVSQQTLLIWAGTMLLLNFIRITIHILTRHKLRPENTQNFALYFIISLALSGSMWGIAGVILFPANDIAYQFFIIFLLAGMGATAVSSMSIYSPVFLAYFPITMLPLAIKLLLMDQQIYWVLGGVSIVYIFILSFFSLNHNRSLVTSLRLRFENTQLIELLKIQKNEAEQANRAKSQFLATASHDLRQPLHALMLNATVLNDCNNISDTQKLSASIIKSVQSLDGLFNALLDISKLDAGIIIPAHKHFRLLPLLQQLATDCQPLAEAKNLTLDIPDSDVTLYSDPTLIERILRNLIQNGIRYTDKGSVQLQIISSGNAIEFRVSDTGIGIAASDFSHIYEEFVQLDNPEHYSGKGLGLGLSIVKRLCGLLGNPIQLESTEGIGSHFYFNVPLGDASAVVEEAPQIIYNSTTLELFIVVIDDDKMIRDGLQNLLQGWGCRTLAFESQHEAMQTLNNYEYPPDIILADYRLRENKTGIQAIDAIKEFFSEEIPALIITGDTASDRLKEAQVAGYQLLHKPFQPSQLRSFIQKVAETI